MIFIFSGALLLAIFTIGQGLFTGDPTITPPDLLYSVVIGSIAGWIFWRLYLPLRNKIKLLEANQFYAAEFIENANDMIQSVTPDGRFIYVNQAWRETLGYQEDEIPNLRLVDIIAPDHWEECQQTFHSILKGESHVKLDTIFTTKNGMRINVSGNINCKHDGDHAPYTRGIFRDITRSKIVKSNLRLMAQFFDHTAEGIMITDLNSNIVAVNQAFCEITGYCEDEVLGQTPEVLESGRQTPAFFTNMQSSLEKTGRWQGEIWNRRVNGEIYPVWLTICAVRDGAGDASHYVHLFTDITSRKKSEERWRHLATHDPLTNLPNRILFADRVEHAIKNSQRTGEHLGMLFIDLDNFKKINDSYGHLFGDLVMQAIAQRLQAQVRESDSVARLGGDEFVVLLENIQDNSAVRKIAQQLSLAIAEPYSINNHKVSITASVGFSIYPQDGQEIEALIEMADLSMYEAKSVSNQSLQLRLSNDY